MSKLIERIVEFCDWPRLAKAIGVVLIIVVAVGTLGWLISYYPTVAVLVAISAIATLLVYLVYTEIP